MHWVTMECWGRGRGSNGHIVLHPRAPGSLQSRKTRRRHDIADLGRWRVLFSWRGGRRGEGVVPATTDVSKGDGGAQSLDRQLGVGDLPRAIHPFPLAFLSRKIVHGEKGMETVGRV